MSQQERIQWLDAELRAERYPNPDSVVAQWNVDRRTAFADLKHLKNSLHAPIATKRGRGWYYTSKTFVLPFLAMTERSAATLRRMLLAGEEYLSATDAESVRHVARMLTSYIPATLPAVPERIRASVHLQRPLASDLLADCEQAALNRQRLHILYHGANRGELTERTVQPYCVVFANNEPYLITFCEWRQAIRTFALGLIRQYRVLPEDRAFVPPPDFDVDAYLARGLSLRHDEALVTVRVRFSPYQARWIRERRYHDSQQTEEQPDGSLLLSMEVAGTEEVRRWLLGYGAEVEVLEPDSLRAEIRAELHRHRQVYDDCSSAPAAETERERVLKKIVRRRSKVKADCTFIDYNRTEAETGL